MRLVLSLTLSLGLATSAAAAPCGNGPAGFNAWLADFKKDAVRQGIRLSR